MSYLGDRLHPWLRSPSPPLVARKLCRGNPLTHHCSPTIVLEEFRMNSSSYCPGRIVALRQCRWVCLVLATLLLYNPFIATPRSGHSLEVCHPASHRATVGASELQHFSPIDGWDNLAVVDSTEAAIVLSVPDPTAQFFFVLLSVPSFAQQVSGPGLWFRPPPAR
jgi:hypothetical protein